MREIHLFDEDLFLQHNAFRSPGAPSLETLRTVPVKSFYFRDIYSDMRRNIFAHDHVSEATADELQGMEFAFVAVDDGAARKFIVEKLREREIPFIVVGMGILEVEGSLIGQLMVATWTGPHDDSVLDRISYEDAGGKRLLHKYPDCRPQLTERDASRDKVEEGPWLLPGPQRGEPELLPGQRQLHDQRERTATSMTSVRHEFVHHIPPRDQMEGGMVYVSIPFATAVHLCCCGCGNEVVTPVDPNQWKLMFDGKSISLSPSIGNWSFGCKSHYWIRRNQIDWAPSWLEEKPKRANHHRSSRSKGAATTGARSHSQKAWLSPTACGQAVRGFVVRCLRRR